MRLPGKSISSLVVGRRSYSSIRRKISPVFNTARTESLVRLSAEQRMQLLTLACGMMPELDSHRPSGENPEPLLSPFSAWHACGPEFKSYAPAMAGSANLQLLAATCRLTPDDSNTTAAAKTWERIFGVDRDGSELVFTNGRMIFVEGTAQRPEGLESITVGIKGRKRFNDLIERAKKVGVERDGRVVMVGVEWRFVVLDNPGAKCKI